RALGERQKYLDKALKEAGLSDENARLVTDEDALRLAERLAGTLKLGKSIDDPAQIRGALEVHYAAVEQFLTRSIGDPKREAALVRQQKQYEFGQAVGLVERR